MPLMLCQRIAIGGNIMAYPENMLFDLFQKKLELNYTCRQIRVQLGYARIFVSTVVLCFFVKTKFWEDNLERGLRYIFIFLRLLPPSMQKNQYTTLVKNQKFALNEMFQKNASKFAIFYILRCKKARQFFFHFMQLYFFPFECLPCLCHKEKYNVWHVMKTFKKNSLCLGNLANF